MSSILAKLRQFEALDTDTISADAIEDTAEALKRENLQQMDAGQKADETEIYPPYAPLTIAIKRMKGQPTDRVTLKDTGSFYAGAYVIVTTDSVLTGSRDEKTVKLVEKYGEAIFGLGGQFKKDYVNNALRPAFREKILQATGLLMK